MSRHMLPFFQPNRPIYVKRPFDAGGKSWKEDELFNWEFRKFPMETVKILFDHDFLKHSDTLETEAYTAKIGDGLTELGIDELHSLVEAINRKVRLAAKDPTEYNRKKCITSKIKDKQIGLIRRWRLTYGELE